MSAGVERWGFTVDEQPPPYTAIIHEAALRMQFGGRDVARAQLHHVTEMSEHPAVSLRVIPFDGTSFPTTGHAIDYFHGPVPSLDTVEVDTAHGSELADAASQLEKYRLVLDRMETVALKPGPSRDLVHSVAQDI
ncbi:Scr1 family TA system antitoxin-like transcriptional regulator [Streptomyces canus]|uniref:DUF5753 domain-containing protein n=1 Tax=Streptomyces canus TaxID=58343 RepID=UPI0036E41E49